MTEPAYLTSLRQSYDTVAADYTRLVKPPADLDPLTRALLAAFAELVQEAGGGPVADLGCGPGRVTAHLNALGLSAFGIDLSPNMIEQARAAYPDLRFDIGSMTALDLLDEELGGVLAFYSTHHTPPAHLPLVFAEFHRILAPGGHLLLSGHIGADERRHHTQAYGENAVSYDSYLLPLDRIAELLSRSGLVVTARLTHEPIDGPTRSYGSLLARKPEQP